MIANGIFHSKLSYCLELFGGTEDYLLKALQRIQTRAARMVCRRGRHYSAAAALREVGWVPVASLVEYYTLVQAKKVLDTQKPTYLYRKLVGSRIRPAYATRLCIGGKLRHGPDAILALTSNSWRWRVRNLWGQVPASIRTEANKIVMFKNQLKEWLWSRVGERI